MANLIEKIKNICDAFDSGYDSYDEAFRKIEAVMYKMNHPDFQKIKDGDLFLYKGIEWIRLGKEQDGILCITAEPVWTDKFDEDGSNNWQNASIHKNLDAEFLKEIGTEQLLPYTSDLTADNGDTSYNYLRPLEYVGLLSCDLYRKYRDFIPLHKDGMWTCTPCSTESSDWGDKAVRAVLNTGTLLSSCFCDSYGVVPACIFKF